MTTRESRRQRDHLRQLTKRMDAESAARRQLEADNLQLRTDLQNERNAKWQALSDRDKRPSPDQLDEVRAQLLVVQSDRDRLTAALETCTRRLASPTAEKDATRAGWRAANLAASQYSRDQALAQKG